MDESLADPDHLRILVANERLDRLDLLATVISQMGHEVIGREIEVTNVAMMTAKELPDVAIVGVGASTEHALDLIHEIVHEAACPVIALLMTTDTAYVREAAKRGIYAAVFPDDPEQLRNAIEVALRRYGDYKSLQDAFARRATIEQAKGILMSRSQLSSDKAFEVLRENSRRTGTKIHEVAAAVIESHGIFAEAPGTKRTPDDPPH